MRATNRDLSVQKDKTMKEQLKRRLLILLAALGVVIILSTVFNHASYDPNFSFVDAISGATRRSRRTDTGATIEWAYSTADLVLPNPAAYTEETIDTENGRYIVLQKAELSDEPLIFLSDKNNSAYANAVEQAAQYYENAGYTVEVRAYSETMMLSLAHAEHFDLFLLREEAVS